MHTIFTYNILANVIENKSFLFSSVNELYSYFTLIYHTCLFQINTILNKIKFTLLDK